MERFFLGEKEGGGAGQGGRAGGGGGWTSGSPGLNGFREAIASLRVLGPLGARSFCSYLCLRG
jgi:hypothetical protein